jgi:hypothetical protein
MKKLFCIAVLASFCASAGAYTCEEVADGLKANYGITKGKFETTAEFAARQKSSQAVPIAGGLKQGDTAKFRTSALRSASYAKYDADKGVMTFDIRLSHDYKSGYLTQQISDRTVKKETYSANNAFGAKAKVEKTERLFCEIGVAKGGSYKIVKLSFKLPKEKAVQTDGNLVLEWEGALSRAQPQRSSMYISPNITSPYEETWEKIIIPLALAKLSVVDSRTGEVMYSTTKLPLARYK